ncbi:MAG: tryptophan synthase subunit alpha, partial [Oxalobacter sp.]|nr:tryptophan synthase subunit alpha [Oxalobacter sp.]
EVALSKGMTLAKLLDLVKVFRQRDDTTPVVLMGYANPIERMGTDVFIRKANESGVDGVLVVDYPPEEATDFAAGLRQAGMDMIFLLAPTSTDERIRKVGRVAGGYLYYVSLKGVTGVGNLDIGEVTSRIEKIRKYVTIPVGVGFGIRDAATARALGSVADAVVIGSRIIQELEKTAPEKAVDAVRAFIADIRKALDE